MSHELFTNVSSEQQEVVAGGSMGTNGTSDPHGVDFQIDATFYAAKQNVLNGATASDPNGSHAASNGSSTKIATAGLVVQALGADEILTPSSYSK